MLDFIARTPSGQGLLRELSQEGVRIAPLTQCPREYYPNGNSAYVFNGKTKTIYLSFGEELGLIAPLFLHEAAHALDPHYHQTHKTVLKLDQELKREGVLAMENPTPKSLSRVLKARKRVDEFQDERTLKSESHAYRKQRMWVEELCQSFAPYEVYLQNKKNHRFLEVPSEQEIAHNYGLKTVLSDTRPQASSQAVKAPW